MKAALQKDATLLADITGATRSEDLHIWWLGQSGFLCQCQGVNVLFDPYLSDSLTRKYAETDKPHVRITEQVIDPACLDMIDVVTSSHNHTDHLDAETLQALGKANPGCRLVLPAANMEFARNRLGDSCGLELCGIAQGNTTRIGNVDVTGISAAHNAVDLDAEGRCMYMGFVVTIGGWRIYHSGDTLWHDALLPELLPHGPLDVMMLPINGNLPERRVAGNLNGTEAAALARGCNAGLVIPCHYDMFEFNTASPDEFEESCGRLGQSHRVMRNGEHVTLSASTESGVN